MFFHLIELIAANSIDIATLELSLEDLGDRDLTELGANTEEIPIHDEGVFIVGHLGGKGSLIFLLCGILLRETWGEVSISWVLTHSLLYIIIIIALIIIFNIWKISKT